ncbi:MAG TPA: hypothetical protein VG269_20745 [Tepidisphaeraceae bacterium]|jgi:hypothetical protein|nr:hypothetical protein [Tepidisphaeraceae bacterium]
MRTVRALLLVLLSLGFLSRAARAEEKPQLWLYYPTNLAVGENIDRLETIMRRASAAGYTHLLLADSKFTRLDEMSKEYFKNCDRVKHLAAEFKMQIVPSVFPIGYSDDLLSRDPNLVEGMPVRDSLFVVKGGEANVVADPPVSFGKVSFKDDTVAVENGVATVHEGKPVARFVYNLKVSPFRCYHVSVKIKTQDFKAQPEIKVLASGDADLQWQNLGVKHTQDWTRHDVVFNSLDHNEVNVYFGVWNEIHGSLQWKDWAIEEVGLVNLIRREGAPCVVKADAGGKTYVEGTDYEKLVDPNMGNSPWKGEFQAWHEPPAIHTKLPDGTRLRVSWYHPAIVYDGQVAACISEPKTMEILADQAKRMKELWGTPMYMMSHDEFRCCNWDESCQKRHETPGKMLAENLKECTKLLRPQQAAVWSDMFDPFHNAVKGPYYLVNGPWTDSWDGLEKDVLILNWNYGKRDESLKFFADRGNPQVIAGYYDGPMSDFTNWMTSAKKVKGVVGYMYTTWQNDYGKVEEFAAMSRK